MAGKHDTAHLGVFITYSRDDLTFADQLDAALVACGFAVSIDRHDIVGGEEWKRRLSSLIRAADTVVFVLSPASARSEVCAWEVAEALSLGKRIIPVACRPLGDAVPPPRLADLNYIYFYPEERTPQSGFGSGLAELLSALHSNLEWMREHTRLLQRALEWQANGYSESHLLFGDSIASAKTWAGSRPNGDAEPTQLQLEFIRASEAAEIARADVERQRLSDVAAAQEARAIALTEKEQALERVRLARRQRARRTNALIVVLTLGAIVSSSLALEAARARQEAQRGFELAYESTRSLASWIAGDLRHVQGIHTLTVDRILEQARNAYRRLEPYLGGTPQLLTDQARLMSAIAETYVSAGDLAKAEQAHRDSLATFQLLLQRDHSSVLLQRSVANQIDELGTVKLKQAAYSEALELFRDALGRRTAIAALDPNSWLSPHDIASSHYNISDVLQKRLETNAAMAQLDLAVAQTEKSATLTNDSSHIIDLKQKLAQIHYVRGKVFELQRRRGEQRKANLEALALRKEVMEARPDDRNAKSLLAWGYTWVGLDLERQLEWEEAAETHSIGRLLSRQLHLADPTNAYLKSIVAFGGRHIAESLIELKRFNEAEQFLIEARQMLLEVLPSESSRPSWRHEYAQVLIAEGRIARARSNIPQAVTHYTAALAALSMLFKRDEIDPEWRVTSARVHRLLGEALMGAGDMEKAITTLRQGYAAASSVLTAFPDNVHAMRQRAEIDCEIGDWHLRRAESKSAQANFASCLDQLEEIHRLDPEDAAVALAIATAEDKLRSISQGVLQH